MFCASIIDPKADEGSYRIECLPQCHDFPSNFRRRQFAYIDWSRSYIIRQSIGFILHILLMTGMISLTQRNALSNTYNASSG